MIKVHFFDWDNTVLDVEQELNTDLTVDEFLMHNIRGIRLDSTDNVADMENNRIFWFSADSETEKAKEIQRLIGKYKADKSTMNYSVSIEP